VHAISLPIRVSDDSLMHQSIKNMDSGALWQYVSNDRSCITDPAVKNRRSSQQYNYMNYIIRHRKGYLFLDKEFILLSRRYQYTQPLQRCSAQVAIRMHTAKKEEELQKRKVPH
jgi:hypothetical protein